MDFYFIILFKDIISIGPEYSCFKVPSLLDTGSKSDGTSVKYKLSVCMRTIKCSHFLEEKNILDRAHDKINGFILP